MDRISLLYVNRQTAKTAIGVDRVYLETQLCILMIEKYEKLWDKEIVIFIAVNKSQFNQTSSGFKIKKELVYDYFVFVMLY